MCRNYAGKFIPNLHPLVTALSIQYSLLILLCLCFLLQVTYLRAWAMNMRMPFLKIISNTYFPDGIFDLLLYKVKFVWNTSRICKIMLSTMCQNQLSNTVTQFLLKSSRRKAKNLKETAPISSIIACYLLQNPSANILLSGILSKCNLQLVCAG